MLSGDKRLIVRDAVKKSKLYTGDIDVMVRVTEDILKKAPFIFEVAQSGNEFYDYLMMLVDATLSKFSDATSENSAEKIIKNTVVDPIEFAYNKLEDEIYYKKLKCRLIKLNKMKPNEKYLSVFHDRYVKKLSIEEICKKYNMCKIEIYFKIIEIAEYVNKKD